MRKYMLIVMLLILPLLVGCSSTKKVSVGEVITFGTYEQDNNLGNGSEPIEWLVLAVENGRALLISKYALDAQPYHGEMSSVTWENCSLRTWLNTDFYKTAFSSSEQKQIALVTLQNPNNWDYGTTGGNSTRDSVFLLSMDEVYKYFAENSGIQCELTDYAYDISDNAGWWLRSPGANSKKAARVDRWGYVDTNGYSVIVSKLWIRPAFWLKQ